MDDATRVAQQHWQILSSDYDTQASFYGVKKACEPCTCNGPVELRCGRGQYDDRYADGIDGQGQCYSLDNKLLLHKKEKERRCRAVTEGFKLELAPLLKDGAVALVKLELRDAAGKMVSDNFYWLGAKSSSYRRLTRLRRRDIVRDGPNPAATPTIFACECNCITPAPPLHFPPSSHS